MPGRDEVVHSHTSLWHRFERLCTGKSEQMLIVQGHWPHVEETVPFSYSFLGISQMIVKVWNMPGEGVSDLSCPDIGAT